MCKWETQRLFSTEELGRCACLTMLASVCICVSRLLASTTNSAQQWVAKICAVRTVNFTTSLLQVLKRPRLHSPRGSSLSTQTLDTYSSLLHTSLKNIYEEAKKKHYLLKVYYNISDSQALRGKIILRASAENVRRVICLML